MVQIKIKLSEVSGPRHFVKIVHPLDPVIPQYSGFSLTCITGCSFLVLSKGPFYNCLLNVSGS